MKILAFTALFLPLLAACSTLVSNDPSADYAPEKLSTSRSGKVVFNPDGAQELVRARREDAYKKIFEFCGSKKYKIDKEERLSAEDAKATDRIATFGAREVIELHFTCD